MCPHPFLIKNPNYNPEIINPYFRQKYFRVPCGRCLVCVDSRKLSIQHQAIYEARKYKGLSCFVTLTYSELAETQLGCYAKKINGKPLYKDGSLIPSIRNKHLQDFMKRLRINLYNAYGYKKDFSYMACSEYGDLGNRNHFHILFFGLSMSEEYIIKDSWRFPCSHPETKKDNCGNYFLGDKPLMIGRVDVQKPSDITQCIKYVSKYLTKSVGTPSNKRQYDEQLIERPKVTHSRSFGEDLYLSQLDYIKSHNFSYSFDGKDYPLPIYIRDKLFGHVLKDDSQTIQQMLERGYKREEITDNLIFQFKINKGREREKKLIYLERLSGNAQFDPDFSLGSYIQDF